MKLKLIITAILVLVLSGCVSTQKGGTETLDQLHRLKGQPIDQKERAGAIRMQALQDVAMSLAAQSGLAFRSKQINENLERDNRTLNQVFDFNSMLLDHNVLPPVLVESRDSLNLASSDSIRLADRTYEIISQARFVTTPPSWREYLSMEFEKPGPPDTTLLPQNSKEREIWNKYIDLGWHEGAMQADIIYSQNLARLKRDYAGIVLYRKLLAQNMVSPPFVAKTDLGVTGGGSDIRIHDQVLRITAMPALRTNSKAWKALMSNE